MKYVFLQIVTFSLFINGCTKQRPTIDQGEQDAMTTNQRTEIGSQHLDIFIGTYTSEEGSKGIYKVQLDTAKGEFGEVQLIAETASPSFIALNNDKTQLFAVNELVPDGTISSFTKGQDDQWTLISQLPALGSAPCHISINDQESMIAVANYVSGNVTSYPINQGTIEDKATTGQHEGTGPNAQRQEGPHAHFTQFSKDQQWLYVVDLGIDEIKAYPVVENGIGEAKSAIKLNLGDGPRHFVFHPTLDIAYVVNELSNTVIAAEVNTKTAEFTEFDRETTLPSDFEEHSQCADIHITSDGKFLYASNRGHNSIAVCSLGEEGKISLVDITSVEGNWPRNFMLTPNEEHLLVANEWSDNIVLFDRDPTTGLINYSGKQIALSKPVCLIN
ncbi:MAG: lactonase family protein [Bacteroidota bacterium]